MRTIFEIANDCAGQALSIIGYTQVEGNPYIDMPPVALASISPIIAAMITATIEREKITALATDDLAKLRLRIADLEAALGSVLKEPPELLLYGAVPDPLEDMRTLAHAIEIPAYRWAPADVVEVLDRGADEIKRLRKIVETLKEAATDD